MISKQYFNVQRGALLLSLLIVAAVGFEFASPDHCADVCDGMFAFRTKLEAEACCQLTRSLTDNTFAPTAAPTPLGTENLRDDSGGRDAGTMVTCRNLGGPSDTSVRVRYGEYIIDQLGDGPNIVGDECGVPTPSLASDNDSTSGAEAAMSAGRWYAAAFVLALTAGIMGY